MTAQQDDTIRAHWRCFVACGIIVLAPFQYGLDFGMIGGFQAMPGFLEVYGHPAPETAIGWNLSTTRQQLISSLMTLGAFLGSSMAGLMAFKLGRRASLWIACVLCAIANIIMMVTTGIGPLYAGRLIIGIANGHFMTFSQLYIQESSPAKYRGLFASFFQFFISFGTLLGTIIDWVTARRPDKSAYLIPLGLIYVVPSILTIVMFFLPESPRWLILQGLLDDGRKSLTWLRPSGFNVDIELNEVQSAIEREGDLASGAAFLEMFKNPVDRRRTAISVGAMALHAASGSLYVMAYKAYFFTMAKIREDPFAMSNVLSTAGLLAIIANAFIVVRYGRRRVLLTTGLLCCGVLQIIMAVVYDKHPGTSATGKVIIALCCFQMMSYQGMVAPCAWLVSAEIPTQRLRSYTYGFASAIGFLFSWLVSFTTPYFINPSSLDWGPRYGYIWFPSCVLSAVWVFFFLPEVKGRTLEEIDKMFLAKLSAREFRKHQLINESSDDGKERASV